MASGSNQTLQCGKISVTNFPADSGVLKYARGCQGDVTVTQMETLHGLQESFLLYRQALFHPLREPCARTRLLASYTKAHC